MPVHLCIQTADCTGQSAWVAWAIPARSESALQTYQTLAQLHSGHLVSLCCLAHAFQLSNCIIHLFLQYTPGPSHSRCTAAANAAMARGRPCNALQLQYQR